MRFLRVSFIAVFTAVVGCVLALFVGDYLTRIAHVPDMEGQRGYMIIFVCAPLGILSGFVIGLIVAIRCRRAGLAGFLIAQGWSSLIAGIFAGLLVGIPYSLSDKPPRIDGKLIELQFELRTPASVKIPDQPNGNSIRVNLYVDNRQSDFAFIDWSSIARDTQHVIIPGRVALMTHSKSRSLFASIGNAEEASQFIELKMPSSPRKEDETWSDWMFATERADLTPVPEPERYAIRYRAQPVDR
ncbi:MAG: hypothetical protein ABI925_02290 [Verrucomicrobiota bacterium]